MKTAVEQILDAIIGEDAQGNDFRVKDNFTQDAISKFLQLEKEQMKKFYGKLQVDENNLIMDFENYYNQTFNQQEQ
jgi:hypothetical protein